MSRTRRLTDRQFPQFLDTLGPGLSYEVMPCRIRQEGIYQLLKSWSRLTFKGT